MQVPGTLGTVSWGHWNPIRRWRHQAEPRGCPPTPPLPCSPQLTREGGGQWGPFRKQDSMPGVRPDNELPQPGSCARRRRAPEGAPSALAPLHPSSAPLPPRRAASRLTRAERSLLGAGERLPPRTRDCPETVRVWQSASQPGSNWRLGVAPWMVLLRPLRHVPLVFQIHLCT